MSVSQSLTLTEVGVFPMSNSSNVRIVWKSTQSGESYNDYTRSANLKLTYADGTTVTCLYNYTLPKNSTVTIVDAIFTFMHNKTDGAGTIQVSTWMDTGISAGVVEMTRTLTLDTIPRETKINKLSCSTPFDGKLSIIYTPASELLYNKCKIDFYDKGHVYEIINLGMNSVKQHTYTVNFSDNKVAEIYSALPDTTQINCKVRIDTYSDPDLKDLLGMGKEREITSTIPDNDATKPTANLSAVPVSDLPSPFNTLYIKGKTKVNANLTNGQGKYSASISSYKVSVDGISVDASSYISGYLTNPGDVVVTGTVTDSRGYSRAYTKTITVLDYYSPRIVPISGESEVIAARCDSSGNLSDTGTYLKIKAKRSYSKVDSGGQKNFCALRYRYKQEGGSYSSWATLLNDTATSDEISTGALLGSLAVAHTYTVQIQAVDTIGETATTTIHLPTEKVYWHRAGSRNSLAIGKYAEEDNAFEVAQDTTAIFRGDVLFKSEAWLPRTLGTGVIASTVNSGRWGGSGVYYRVLAGGKHIYVAFNVSFTTSSSTVRAESETIPFPPNYDVYALCPVGFSDGSRGIATVSVSPRGRVNIYAVHKLPGATLSTGETVSWIDGYIDYWT